MKHTFIINRRSIQSTTAFLLLLAIGFMSSCKKDDEPKKTDDTGNNPPTANAPTKRVFRAKIDGVLWESDTTTISAIYTGAAKSLVMSASKADGSQFTVQINFWDLKTGNFNTTLVSQTNYVGLTYKDAAGKGWTAPAKINNDANNLSSGTLKIEYYDGTKVKGGFNFTAGSQTSATTYAITEGEFAILKIN